MKVLLIVTFSLLAVVLMPLEARAQAVAASFDQLQQVLRQGDTLDITDRHGTRIEGRVVDLSDSALELQLNPGADSRQPGTVNRRLTEQDVAGVQVVHRDSVLNGTIIGLGAAAFPGIVLIEYGRQATRDGYSTGAGISTAGAILIGAGAGIGALVDAGLHRRTTVFQTTEPRSHVSVFPLLSPTAAGVRVAMALNRQTSQPASPALKTAAPQRSWPARHPVLLGALAGTGVGLGMLAAEGCSSSSDYSCGGLAMFFGGTGAGIGALGGVAVGFVLH